MRVAVACALICSSVALNAGMSVEGLEIAIGDLSAIFRHFGEARPPQVQRGLMLSALASRHGYGSRPEEQSPPVRRSLDQLELQPLAQQLRPQPQQQRPAFGTLGPTKRAPAASSAAEKRHAEGGHSREAFEQAALRALYYAHAGDRGWNMERPCAAIERFSSRLGGGGVEASLSPEDEALNTWLGEWQRLIQSWWLVTPFQDGLRSCMGTFSLLLSSKLHHFSASWFGVIAPPPPPPLRLVQDEACEWVGSSEFELKLPPFPDLPSHFQEVPVVPLPRLLPNGRWLQSLEVQHPQHVLEHNELVPPMRTSSLLAVGMGTGSVVLMVAVAMRVWMQRRKGRIELKRLRELRLGGVQG